MTNAEIAKALANEADCDVRTARKALEHGYATIRSTAVRDPRGLRDAAQPGPREGVQQGALPVKKALSLLALVACAGPAPAPVQPPPCASFVVGADLSGCAWVDAGDGTMACKGARPLRPTGDRW